MSLELDKALRDLEQLEDELHATGSQHADRLTDIRSRLVGALLEEEIATQTEAGKERTGDAQSWYLELMSHAPEGSTIEFNEAGGRVSIVEWACDDCQVRQQDFGSKQFVVLCDEHTDTDAQPEGSE